MTPYDIVKDSSIWYNPISLSATFQLDNVLYTGIVKSVLNDSETNELRYMVEVHHRGNTFPIACRTVSRFGGVFNYEDVVARGYNYNTPSGIAAKAGDHVLIGLIGGQGRDGVILGGLTHPSRKCIDADAPEYKSEFNGIETYINKDGEYTLTFKAQPINLAQLEVDPAGRFPPPIYDVNIGSSYLKFDKTGGFTVSDSSFTGTQYFKIDKLGSTLELASGSVSLKMEKLTKSFTVTSPDIKLGSALATEQAILGTTYRTEEGILNSTLSAHLSNLAAALAAAAADPVLAGLCPVAASSIAAAGVQAGAMAGRISSFEAKTATYLSNTVKVQ